MTHFITEFPLSRGLALVAFLLPGTAFANCILAQEDAQSWAMNGAALARAVEDCLAEGVDLTAPLPSGDNPLHMLIATTPAPEAVGIALAAGADPNVTGKHGSPAFVDMVNFAMEKDDPDVIAVLKLLGEAGADFSRPDNQDQSALSMAAGGGEVETVRVLLQYGADPNGLNAYSRTPLFETVFGRCSPEVGELLIEHGARLDPMPQDQIDRMFEEAAESCADLGGGDAYVARLRELAGR